MFTVNIRLKPNALPYLNRNVYIYDKPDVWSHSRYIAGRPVDCALVSYAVPNGADDGCGERGAVFAENIDILTPMFWDEVAQWEQTSVGRRGDDYKEFKRRKAEECIDFVSRRIPGLRDAIDKVYTSTPLTWRDYTGTVRGSAYGIVKDYAELKYTILPARTPVPNVFMTGQNLSVHGILGVSMTSLMTCAQIPGAENIISALLEAE